MKQYFITFVMQINEHLSFDNIYIAAENKKDAIMKFNEMKGQASITARTTILNIIEL